MLRLPLRTRTAAAAASAADPSESPGQTLRFPSFLECVARLAAARHSPQLTLSAGLHRLCEHICSPQRK